MQRAIGSGPSRTIRLHPAAFPPPVGPRLRAAIAAAHAEQPFSPLDPRDAARRVSHVASRLSLEVTVYRGGLDVGGAELDTVWAVVDGRVVDPARPLLSEHFVDAIRAYVAGFVEEEELDRVAHPYSVRWRVVGSFPPDVRYVGAPVLGSRG